MDLQSSIHQLLKEIGPGRMDSVAYDTAWVARLAQLGEPIGEQALEWLREHQLPDGSWGAAEIRYYHDRLVCTLAAMIALAERGEERDRRRLQRAQQALEVIARGLGADPAGETVGFEMIVPALIDEAQALGAVPGLRSGALGDVATRMARYRAMKLAALPDQVINRFVTLAFSSEMVGAKEIHLLDTENLQESNGSVGHSPSATAFFALHVQQRDEAALQYLSEVIAEGGVPGLIPFDVFERAWVLWNLALAMPLDQQTRDLCLPHLRFLESAWDPQRGIGLGIEYSIVDGDNTGVVLDLLTRFGHPVSANALRYYEYDSYYRCYDLEANPSTSVNIHIMGALRTLGLSKDSTEIKNLLHFLHRTQTLQTFWFDKWHISPYYPTAHAVMVCGNYDKDLVDDAIYWIKETQNANGSWGYYLPTAEETAYCLQALIAWRRFGEDVPVEVIKRGATWLAEHAAPPYPPLWTGKGLYSPTHVVRSAILSALLLATQEIGGW